jgi:hypothetical protein
MTLALYLLGTAAAGAVCISTVVARRQLASKEHAPAGGAQPDWTGADYDSHQVLASIGEPDPVARVTQARASRIVRPAGARIVRGHSGLHRGTAR